MPDPCLFTTDNEAPLKPVTVEELIERCGGDFIDAFFISGPIKSPDVFQNHSSEDIRTRTVNTIRNIGGFSRP